MFKRILKVFLFLIFLTGLLALGVFLQSVDPAQTMHDTDTHIIYSFQDTLAGREYNLDSIKTLIGEDKTLPPGFELAGAIALSAYPELKDVPITLVLTQDGAPMESSPVFSSLFNPFSRRRYEVLLNDAPNSYFEPILLRSLPFDAQVGILAHELGHIVYYEHLNLLSFGKWGIEYLKNSQFRAIHERTTDLMPVYHGLGNQIYQYAFYVRYDPSCIGFYKEGKSFMDTYYLTDKELATAVRQYQTSDTLR